MASCVIWYFLPRAWERITIQLLPSEGGIYLACQNREAPYRRILSNIIFIAHYICYLVPSESYNERAKTVQGECRICVRRPFPARERPWWPKSWVGEERLFYSPCPLSNRPSSVPAGNSQSSSLGFPRRATLLYLVSEFTVLKNWTLA